jgi:hypothetical protein
MDQAWNWTHKDNMGENKPISTEEKPQTNYLEAAKFESYS